MTKLKPTKRELLAALSRWRHDLREFNIVSESPDYWNEEELGGVPCYTAIRKIVLAWNKRADERRKK